MGLICCDKPIVVKPPITIRAGGSGKGFKTVYIDKDPHEITWERLHREDDEILTIIKIFLKCQ